MTTTTDKPRKKRVFIASSQADVGEVKKAIQHFDLDAVTLDQAATPGTTWVDSLHRCVNDADMVNEAIGQMFRALEPIPNGCGIVLYKEAGAAPKPAPRSLPVTFVSAEEFLTTLRDTGLTEYVRKLRNTAFHGL